MSVFTAGDNDEYSHLLYDLANDKENLSTADIIEIAADIMAHSDMSDDYSVDRKRRPSSPAGRASC